MRLAFTLIAAVALFAAAFSWLQYSSRTNGRSSELSAEPTSVTVMR